MDVGGVLGPWYTSFSGEILTFSRCGEATEVEEGATGGGGSVDEASGWLCATQHDHGRLSDHPGEVVQARDVLDALRFEGHDLWRGRSTGEGVNEEEIG